MSEEKKTVEEQTEAKVEEPKVDETKVETQISEAPAQMSEAPVAESQNAEVMTEEKPAELPTEIPAEGVVEKPTEPYYEGAVNKGDFILIEMTGKATETGEVFDTTSEETAREKGIHREDRVYGPRLVVVGEGWVLRGLDAKLPGVKPGEQTNVEVPPAEAFGERDPTNLQLVPYRQLRSKGVNPVLGAELEIEGRQAVIRSIGAGRVQVDYNHPLAGRNILYELKVNEIITDEKAKVKALINRRFVGVDANKFEQKLEEKVMTIVIPDEIFFSENIQIAKRGLAIDILKFFPSLEEVKFQETIKRSQ